MIGVIIFDYNGTLHDAFSGANRLSVWCRQFSSRRLRMLYPLFESAERILGIYRPLFGAGIACLDLARKQGLMVGIATDRSFDALARSAERGGLDIQFMDFVRVRKSVLSRRIVPSQGLRIWHSVRWKDEPGGLSEVVEYFGSLGMPASSVLLVGDDERDCRAARLAGFRFVGVDHYKPDFTPVYRAIVGYDLTGA